jgi:SHS2 domain-containing protein
MSGDNLQEMETAVGTQSKTAVNSGAKSADPMPKMADPGTQLASVEDLGGPTPENYKPDDDSAKLREPSLKTVADIVKKGSKPADSMPKMAKEESEVEEEVIEESPEITEEEVVEESAEKVLEVTDEVDVEEDVNALLGGEELSEEFREKAKTIFEAALKTKVVEIKEALEAQYEAKLQEGLDEAKSELTERVDSYLEYVSGEWVSENKLAIENGIKTEMTESFLSGMRGLFEEHYVTIPEEKYDVLHSMVEKLDEMETKLNEQINKNISLNKRLAESVADSIFDHVSEGLATTQKEKLASLVESVEFESETAYREKLKTLRESYFPTRTATSTVAKTETLSEGVESVSEEPSYTADMASYMRALQSVAKNN